MTQYSAACRQCGKCRHDYDRDDLAVVAGTYDFEANERFCVNHTSVNGGPMMESSGDVAIVAAIRDSWSDGQRWLSFVQTMGLSASQAYDTYLFPAYNNVSLNEQLRFGVP